MFPGRPAPKHPPHGGLIADRRCHPDRATPPLGGFTLVETMVATLLFTMVALGVYGMLIKSYQMSALSRAVDEARGVLRTYADQFQRLQTTDRVGTATYNRWLFNPTSGPTGRGLVWGELNNANTSVNAADLPYLPVTLGGSGHSIAAKLTRDVRYLDAASGNTTSAQTIEAAGYLLSGTFTLTFEMNRRTYVQSISIVRAAP